MIKGAIDDLRETEIAGWVYSDLGPVKNRTVLAYLEQECLGSGQIDLFRQDLLDAGLADGVLGFRFAISPVDSEQLPRLTIKLEESDLVLFQGGSAAPNPERTEVQSEVLRPVAELEWMHSRGWLDQSEFDLLRFLSQRGVYDKLLLGAAENTRVKAAKEARHCLELVYMQELRVTEQRISDRKSVV